MIEPSLAERLDYHRAQGAWTRALRDHLYRLTAIGTRRRALDVGCGGGWLTAELAGKVRETAVGCDTDEAAVARARSDYPRIAFEVSETKRLPFADASFDWVGCHFALLWAAEPPALLAEMRRVTAPGGVVVALAEPDWDGYVEWPDFGLREAVAGALASQRAEPRAGRRLREWFAAAGMAPRLGVTGGPWEADEADRDAAWRHHRFTLRGLVPDRRLRVWEKQERAAWAAGTRVVHLPIFWAVADR